MTIRNQVRCFRISCFFSGHIIDKLVKGGQLTRSISAEDTNSDVIVSEAMDEHLVYNLVPVDNLLSTGLVRTGYHHPTHVGCCCQSSGKCSDWLITLLRHFPKIHHVNGLVNNNNCELFHFGKEQRHCSERGVGPCIKDPLSERIVTGCLELHELDSGGDYTLLDIIVPLNFCKTPLRFCHFQGKRWSG